MIFSILLKIDQQFQDVITKIHGNSSDATLHNISPNKL